MPVRQAALQHCKPVLVETLLERLILVLVAQRALSLEQPVRKRPQHRVPVESAARPT